MFKTKILLPALILSAISFTSASAQIIPEKTLAALDHIVDKVTVSCLVDRHEDEVYSGEFIDAKFPTYITAGELFEVEVTIKNTGNMPWFSSVSGCNPPSPYAYLGTTRAQDRESQFQAPAIFGQTNWYTSNRIELKTPRVNPGETAIFHFTAHAPTTPGIYREYFAPVIENTTWVLDKAEFNIDFRVGEFIEDENILRFTSAIEETINLLDPAFYGDKKIIVDLSDQRMFLQIGGKTIREFIVSTGKRATPTPVGKTKILSKQHVRVAGSAPHYIMPRFMMFRKGGYGIHALPSLANDRGVFWREALNHIGTPRSHGCIRLLPDDAEFAFLFSDVGTEVEVVR